LKEIEYYKINEALSNKYYQIPHELFESSLYKNNLNSDSKILYAFLLDRLTLSQKNHWVDKEHRIYLIFTREEVQEKLNLSDKTVTKAFKQLSDVGLVEEKRQGLGKPNLIYVGKIQYEEPQNLRFQNRKNYDSATGNVTTLESENLRGIKTNNINTNKINPKSDNEIDLQKIKERCKLNEFKQEEIIVLEDVIDSLYYKENLKVGNLIVTREKILDKLNLIVKENLIQLLEILHGINNIQNAKNYLMICLYNNLGNTNICNKKITSTLTYANKREYSDSFFDSLYANVAYENNLISS